MAITNKSIAINSKKNYEQMRARDNELVRGRFKYDEVPGGSITFSFGKYKGDPIIDYTVIDGQVRTVPRSVAKHLATSGSYPVHEYQTDSNGKRIARVSRRVNRYSFTSVDSFDNDDDIIKSRNSEILTVEKL